MLSSFLILLQITFITTYIIDKSGFIFSISKWLYEKLNPTKVWMGQLIPKPFSCSLCSSFWLVLVVSLFNFQWEIVDALTIASIMAIMAKYIKYILNKI